jgi:hypothetical protein
MIDGALASHIILWAIGALGLVGTILAVSAMFVLGRQSSYDL